ncbi:protein SRG1-like [Senna tora]|uniref:Protein SRG1-like n=1 Tax=Senna tora TaxID=362788 RepID=A0A834SRX1_9FABA|nr:protein SRG1-like [Senna tora]
MDSAEAKSMSENSGSVVVPCVKELAKQPLKEVPERYLRTDLDLHHTFSSPHQQIPIIDMSKLLCPEFHASELNKFDFACKEWGFFQQTEALTELLSKLKVSKEVTSRVNEMEENNDQEGDSSKRLEGVHVRQGMSKGDIVRDMELESHEGTVSVKTLEEARVQEDGIINEVGNFLGDMEEGTREGIASVKTLEGPRVEEDGTITEVGADGKGAGEGVLGDILNLIPIVDDVQKVNGKEGVRTEIRRVVTWKRLARGDGIGGVGTVIEKSGPKRKSSGGDGASTNIWQDPWVPGLGQHVLDRFLRQDEEVKWVGDLINEQSEWRWDCMRRLFPEDVVQRISRIHLDTRHGEDCWSWSGNPKGFVTVKLCYNRVMEAGWRDVELVKDSAGWVREGFWKRIWKLSLMPKYKSFIWRVCLDILPSCVALNERGMEIDDMCLWCGRERESSYHVLVECNKVREVWERSRFDFGDCRYFRSVLEWLNVEGEDWAQDQWCLMIIAMYLIWEGRNSCRFKNENVNFSHLWCRAASLWDEVGNVQELEVECNMRQQVVRWEKPAAPFCKLNTDAGTLPNEGGILGGVVCDQHGVCLAAFTEFTNFSNDPILLEAEAIKRGMELALEAGVKDLVIEGDAQLVFNMLTNMENAAMSPFYLICNCILNLINMFSNFRFSWVPRTCNKLINHGVDVSLVENVKKGVTEFFNLPMDEKNKFWQNAEDGQGFGQQFVYSKEQKLEWADIKNLNNYCVELRKLAIKMIELVGEALKIEPTEMKKLGEEGWQSMRMNYYPPCPQAEKVIGLSPHSDICMLTILLQVNEMEGLQINKEGKWVPISPLPNAFVINIGDSLEIVSNGIYRSVEHRATVNSQKERMSIATFYSAKQERNIGPSPSLVTPQTPPLFKTIRVSEYRRRFFSRQLSGKSLLDSIRIQN